MEESLVVRLQSVVLKILSVVSYSGGGDGGGLVSYPVVSLDDQFKINGSIFLVRKIMTTDQSGQWKIIQIKFRQADIIPHITPPLITGNRFEHFVRSPGIIVVCY